MLRAEAVGTFFLIYTGTATAAAGALGKATAAGSPPNSLAVALAFGLVLAALVGALGQVSGAHLNGAVTLGLAVTRKFPWRYVPAYLGFQLLGAIAGSGATWATFGNAARSKAKLGATVPAAGVSDGRAFIVEALITFLLVFVIMAVATDKRVPAALAATSIGFALVAAVLIGGGITGGAVNPDRALGPAIMAGEFTSVWVYVLAEVIGGIAAALLYTVVVSRASAPTMEHGDPQAGAATGAWRPAPTSAPIQAGRPNQTRQPNQLILSRQVAPRQSKHRSRPPWSWHLCIGAHASYFRRTHLSPMPVVDSLADLNDKISQWDLDDENRHIDNHIRTVAQDFAFERTQLTPITAERSRASGVAVSLPGGRPKRFMSCREHSRRSGVGESR